MGGFLAMTDQPEKLECLIPHSGIRMSSRFWTTELVAYFPSFSFLGVGCARTYSPTYRHRSTLRSFKSHRVPTMGGAEEVELIPKQQRNSYVNPGDDIHRLGGNKWWLSRSLFQRVMWGTMTSVKSVCLPVVHWQPTSRCVGSCSPWVKEYFVVKVFHADSSAAWNLWIWQGTRPFH